MATQQQEISQDSPNECMTEKLAIRPGTRNDIQEIVRVCTSSIEEGEDIGFGTPISNSQFGNTENLLAAWRDPNLVGRREVFVVEMNGRLVGCASIEEWAEEIELVDIDVVRDCQGQGIGSRIVLFVEDLAKKRGKRAVTLGTSRNASGVPWKSFPWWLNRGYEVTHEEENEWTRSIAPGTREIRMRKQLSD